MYNVHNECHYFPHYCDTWCCLQLLTSFPIFGVNTYVEIHKIALKYLSVIQTLNLDMFLLISENVCSQINLNASIEDIFPSKVLQVSVF
jgi:hypothetical protein